MFVVALKPSKKKTVSNTLYHNLGTPAVSADFPNLPASWRVSGLTESVISKSLHCYFVTLIASDVSDPCRMWLEVMKGIHSTSL